MAQPTKGELAYSRMLQFMRGNMWNNRQLDDISKGALDQIARAAAGHAKFLIEKQEDVTDG